MNKHMTKDLIFIDIETTDIDEATATVLEIGAIRTSPTGEVLAQFEMKVFPQSEVNPVAASINGYSKVGWAKSAEQFTTALSAMRAALLDPFPGQPILVSYFMFDRNILVRQQHDNQLTIIPFSQLQWLNFADTAYPLVLTGRIDSRKLVDVATYLEVAQWKGHRALGDAIALSQCYFAFLQRFSTGFIASAITKKLVEGFNAWWGKPKALGR